MAVNIYKDSPENYDESDRYFNKSWFSRYPCPT